MRYSGLGEVEIENVTLNPETGFCSSSKTGFSADAETMKNIARAFLY
jgi:hypothetical protein